jgi:hypothetical protein
MLVVELNIHNGKTGLNEYVPRMRKLLLYNKCISKKIYYYDFGRIRVTLTFELKTSLIRSMHRHYFHHSYIFRFQNVQPGITEFIDATLDKFDTMFIYVRL